MTSPTVRLACEAMATRFEMVLHGDDPIRLRAAGEEALAEVARIEARLSLFRPTSDVGRINRGAADGPVRIGAETFELLVRARELYELTGGVFDVTVGPLMRCWGFRGAAGIVPSDSELEHARDRVGMHLLELNEGECTVRFRRPGLEVDLGAIGKGYALDAVTRTLRETGVLCALVHGGTSTVSAIGCPPSDDAWRVAVEYPRDSPVAERGELLAVVSLHDEALSVSAVWGRSFGEGGRDYGHVLDPRIGRPVERSALAAAVMPGAIDADALSTALLTLGVDEHPVVTEAFPSAPFLIVASADAADLLAVVHRGFGVSPSPRLGRLETIADRTAGTRQPCRSDDDSD
jgi:FAD:protein FMN transferase